MNIHNQFLLAGCLGMCFGDTATFRYWNTCIHHTNVSYWYLYIYGYGSIPINTIFRGMNIHLPAMLMFTRGTRFWPIPILIVISPAFVNRIVQTGQNPAWFHKVWHLHTFIIIYSNPRKDRSVVPCCTTICYFGRIRLFLILGVCECFGKTLWFARKVRTC